MIFIMQGKSVDGQGNKISSEAKLGDLLEQGQRKLLCWVIAETGKIVFSGAASAYSEGVADALDAWNWINLRNSETNYATFEGICKELGYDATLIRYQIKREFKKRFAHLAGPIGYRGIRPYLKARLERLRKEGL